MGAGLEGYAAAGGPRPRWIVTGTSSSSARAKYGSSRGSLGAMPRYCAVISPNALIRPALISSRTQAMSGNSVPFGKHGRPKFGPRPFSHGKSNDGITRSGNSSRQVANASGTPVTTMYWTCSASSAAISLRRSVFASGVVTSPGDSVACQWTSITGFDGPAVCADAHATLHTLTMSALQHRAPHKATILTGMTDLLPVHTIARRCSLVPSTRAISEAVACWHHGLLRLRPWPIVRLGCGRTWPFGSLHMGTTCPYCALPIEMAALQSESSWDSSRMVGYPEVIGRGRGNLTGSPNFRRLVERYERYAENSLGMRHFAACLILLRRL